MDSYVHTLDEDPEAARRRALAEYRILDTPHEERFDRIARLAARLMDAPVAQINFVDDHRIWPKACHGAEAIEAKREDSFCHYALLKPLAMVVQDAQADPRFDSNGFVTGAPHVRFYAGAQLRNREGVVLGTLCVIDFVPRRPAAEDIAALRDLAQLAVAELELRRTTHRLANQLTEERRLSDALEAGNERMADFLAATSDLLWETDADLRVTGGGGRVGGVGIEQLQGKALNHMAAVFPTPGASRRFLGELRAQRAFRAIEFHRRDEQGKESWVEVSGRPVFADGAFTGYRGVTRDITDRKVAEAKVERLAGEDPLTGLPNRRVFDRALEKLTAGSGTRESPGAVLVLDIDRFKLVNDRHGHDAGDKLVRAVGARIAACVRAGDVVSRIGGDEFAVILRGAPQTQVEMVAQRILAAMQAPFDMDGEEIHASLSIGGALMNGLAGETAMKHADVALYRSKNAGRGCYNLYAEAH